MDTVTITCYGRTKTMYRSAAIRMYTEGALSCEGSERDRYVNILADLLAGRSECSDTRD